MSEREVFDTLQVAWFVFAAVVFVALQFITAPYGRHVRKGWGPIVPGWVAWPLMELPALLTFPICFLLSDRQSDPASIAFLVMWELHYINRGVIYPIRRGSGLHSMPAVITLVAFVTNVGISYLNARWLFTFAPTVGAAWLADPRFLIGATLFVVGFAVNVHSDEVLRALKGASPGRYSIPQGGAYRWVSCPNYLGELIEWAGWAIATWSVPGFAFFLWSASNLTPRARDHHRWYRETFADYPRDRRALIPYVL